MSQKTTTLLSTALIGLMTLLLAGCSNNLFDRIGNFWSYGCCGAIIIILDILALIEVAGSSRSVGDKVLWALLIIFAPVLGCIIYYLFGRS